MEYCFVAGNYPYKERQVHVFLENVVTRLVDRGETCNVIAPQSYYAYYIRKRDRRPVVDTRVTPGGNQYKVYSPLYFVYPKFKVGNLSMHNLSRKHFYQAVERVYRQNDLHADVIYSHFFQAGIAGVKLATQLGLPSFIANGEADTIDSLKLNNPNAVRETLDHVTGIISVSTKNKNEIKELSHNDPAIMKKVRIIVNAVDIGRFYKKDREQVRKEMGWSNDQFIVAFTGTFIERKGVKRLSHALDRFDDVYSIFMGVGEEQPTCKNILHCGRVENVKMNDYLNAADVFVLPTLAEGCSNAIVEAVAAGLPVISSDMEFNYDVLDDSCSILIDPNDEEAIYQAILKLKTDPELRNKLASGAEKKAKELSLDVRVDKIQTFINEKMTE
ncbi:glycosyltransferase family 4 protein [Ruminococcus sp.]|uniref:glycosyltransferase family 4 protein n=1 Tax=Ruminococcus sp. TaxID=41978 RepID=UPI002E80B53F|nr:glycosyltransferase family 4 protein [Ruminococcus sp.]MEE3491935.1 glycosyltransferase family 4 protein [Ruminococcus sp.]